MPSFADSIFLFVLALLLFGPKKLPVLARELGKWMGEFRRASNEFKMQMEDELRASEQADRQKQITAMEAAAPIPPALDEPVEPEHPHMRHSTPTQAAESAAVSDTTPIVSSENTILPPNDLTDPGVPALTEMGVPSFAASSQRVGSHNPSQETADTTRPIPIATSGSLHMMPPSTGLPTPRSTRPNGNPLDTLVESIPEAPTRETPETESLAHGD